MYKEKVYVGFESSVIIEDENGILLGGGFNFDGQLGDKNEKMKKKFSPLYFPKKEKIKKISCKNANCTFALTEKGKIFATGFSFVGTLGQHDQLDTWKELKFRSFSFKNKKIKAIFTGGKKAFYLMENGELYFAGTVFNLGNKTERSITPLYVPLDFLEKNEKIKNITGGGYFSLLLSNQGNVYSLGNGDEGGTGQNTTKTMTQFTKIRNYGDNNKEKGIKIVKIACGFSHSLFLTEKNEVYACGSNLFGQLGIKDGKLVSFIPKHIRGLHNIIKIDCGAYTSFFVSKEFKIYGCGHNENHQLAIGKIGFLHHKKIVEPTLIKDWKSYFNSNDYEFVDVFCGYSTTYFINKEGYIFSCGNNENCECILGEEGNSNHQIKVPTEIKSGRIKLEIIENNKKDFILGNKEAIDYADVIIKTNDW